MLFNLTQRWSPGREACAGQRPAPLTRKVVPALEDSGPPGGLSRSLTFTPRGAVAQRRAGSRGWVDQGLRGEGAFKKRGAAPSSISGSLPEARAGPWLRLEVGWGTWPFPTPTLTSSCLALCPGAASLGHLHGPSCQSSAHPVPIGEWGHSPTALGCQGLLTPSWA